MDTATHCNTLQHTATHYNAPRFTLQCVAYCSVSRCVAVWCGVLRCVAVCYGVLRCVVVCCSVLQCVAVCCSVHDFSIKLLIKWLLPRSPPLYYWAHITGWQRPIECLNLQAIFRKRATNYRAFLLKWPMKMRYPMGLCHRVSINAQFNVFPPFISLYYRATLIFQSLSTYYPTDVVHH